MKLKNILFAICGATLMPLTMLSTGCGKPNEINVVAKDVYAMSALTSVNYLKQMDESSSVALGNASSPVATARPEYISETNVAGVKSCLTMFESVIAGGGIKQTTTKNSETELEFSEYNFVMSITIPTTNETIKMYYNEIDSETEIEVEDEKQELEVSSTLAGVIVLGDSTYTVTGEREFETDGDETEATIEFTTKSSINPTNYIVVSQSVENDEIEYEYKIYQNGVKVQDTEIEVENEDGKFELEFQLKDISNGTLEKTKYKITKG